MSFCSASRDAIEYVVSPFETTNSSGVSSVPPGRRISADTSITTAVATIARIANIKNTTRKKRTTTAPFGNIYGVGVTGNNGSIVAVAFGAPATVAVSAAGAVCDSAAIVLDGVGIAVVVIAGMRVGS